jgi:hypothetical protein
MRCSSCRANAVTVSGITVGLTKRMRSGPAEEQIELPEGRCWPPVSLSFMQSYVLLFSHLFETEVFKARYRCHHARHENAISHNSLPSSVRCF